MHGSCTAPFQSGPARRQQLAGGGAGAAAGCRQWAGGFAFLWVVVGQCASETRARFRSHRYGGLDHWMGR